jgi:cold shock CspA family protein
MPPTGDKIAQKWGFGMAPLLPKTEDRYRTAVLQVRTFLGLEDLRQTRLDAAAVSEVKGLVNRCIRQDQWDWFTVYSRFGAPDPRYLQLVSNLLPELRVAIVSDDMSRTERLHEQLNWTPLLTCCLRFLGEQAAAASRPVDSGYLYVLSTREFPELLKIGFTVRSVEERVKEINSATGVVFPFSARRVFYVREAHRVERRVFEALDPHRIRADREFFRIDYATATREIEACLFSERFLHRSTGQILWYSTTLGYGFAAMAGGESPNVFIHRSQLVGMDETQLQPDSQIEFEACVGAKGLFAMRVRRLSDQ